MTPETKPTETMTASITENRFQLITDSGTYREQTSSATNIRTAEYFADAPQAGNPVLLAQKNGLTKEETDRALYVLVWPVKGSGCGSWVTIRATSKIFPEVRALLDARLQAEAAGEAARKNSVTVTLSTRGWGDYCNLTVTVDRRKSDEEILGLCREALANGHDVDRPDQTDEEILEKIAEAKGAGRREVEAMVAEIKSSIAGLDRSKLVATDREARAAERRYNDIHNEGGEGYVPHVVSQEEYDRRVAEIARLSKSLATL